MWKWITSLISVLTYFGLPIAYIYFYELQGKAEEKHSMVALSLVGLVLFIAIIVLTYFIFKIKKIYYIKLFIITLEIIGVLFLGYKFFDYINVNIETIKAFILVCIGTTMIGFIPTSISIHLFKKENII